MVKSLFSRVRTRILRKKIHCSQKERERDGLFRDRDSCIVKGRVGTANVKSLSIRRCKRRGSVPGNSRKEPVV